ncbi:phylloplanin-like [Rutidosis leptorrhynchoides]|uniref:phylloplanin-like n=1 Tax=Rutidosis leptorrhynchoides TaxID=125765 RepID=UPI003A99AC25
MAPMKSVVLVTLLIFVIAATQIEAQLGLLSVINVAGNLFCSLNGNAVANATTPTPAFQNALVQVSCGGNVIASALTNQQGQYNIVLNSPVQALSALLSNCNLVVATPLSSCNASLPSLGNLQSPLVFLGNTLRGLLNIVNLVPTVFTLIGV